MPSALYEALGLHQTIRVHVDGTIERGIDVPHLAANIACNHQTGEWRDPDSGVLYPKRCQKRADHPTPKGETPHVPVDIRLVASPPRVIHSRRFAPNGIPNGVDMSITADHDCGNHLPDVAEVERRGW